MSAGPMPSGRVALTGAAGMLGRAVRRVFGEGAVLPFTHADLDVTDLDGTVRTVRDARPGLLIHAAAFTDVDRCETEFDTAFRVNALGARNAAIACEEAGCPIIYISSDYVFDGTKGAAYDEWDETKPVNAYGLSKLLGERFVASHSRRFFIVRTSWLYGPGGKNFVDTISGLLGTNESLRVVADQTGSPTFSSDLALFLRKLGGRGYGTYHFSNSGSCTWHEFACEIALLRGSRTPVVPVTTAEFPRPAKRPAFSALNHTMLRLEGMEEPRHWKEALSDYLLNSA
ncbi:MAG: dTDP-4-dehydrorhamnose reductase [Thermodesulfovibrionales bacterium]